MIEAWFETLSDPPLVIPAYMPTPEIIDLAKTLGLGLDDLFSVKVPGGASRCGEVNALVSKADLQTLYASTSQQTGPACAVFRWRESSLKTAPKMLVWLMPPKPLWLVPQNDGVPPVATARGVVRVQAFDVRYWWQATVTQEDDLLRPQSWFTDGRWTTDQNGNNDIIDALIGSNDPQTGLMGLLPFTTWIDRTGLSVGANNASSLNRSRLANLLLHPNTNTAVQIDLCLSAIKFALIWDPTISLPNFPYGKFVIRPINDDRATLGAWMDQQVASVYQNKRASAGGAEPTSGAIAPHEVLLDQWDGTAAQQYHRAPGQVRVSNLPGFVEGQIFWSNLASDTSLLWQYDKQYEVGYTTVKPIVETLTTDQPRPTPVLGVRVFPESRPIGTDGAYTTLTFLAPVPPPAGSGPSWDWDVYQDQVAAAFADRCKVIFNRTAWAGWTATMPAGVYRVTQWSFVLHRIGDEFAPVTITEAAENDWLLGPDGRRPNEPKDIICGDGMLTATRLSNGVTKLTVPPPNCRMFPAVITNAERVAVGGNGYWQWLYSWNEVEPNPEALTPLAVTLGALNTKAYYRASHNGQSSPSFAPAYARNLCENANIYTAMGAATNRIGPGVVQSAVTQGNIEPLPICNGTVVMMVEHCLTLYEGADSTPPWNKQYWFSMPNVVNVICT